MDAFAAAARDWRELLREAGEPFVTRHLDAAMQLAVALHLQSDAEAARVAADVRAAESRDFLALAAVLRRLVEAAAREHMTFLLPDAQATARGAELARQQALAQTLPDAFQRRFRQLLLAHWTRLARAADSARVSLPRLQQMHWEVAADARVLLRLQTSDGRSRVVHVPLRQFHQLRHSAAAVLQEMNQVEAHPMMRLAYMEQSARADAAPQVAAGNVP